MTDADLRIDPLTGANVVVTPWRQQRPNLPEGHCPFCPGGLEAPGPYDVRHFQNRWPALPGGRHEVILHSPDHDASFPALGEDQAARVVELWSARTAALGSREDVAYVFVFENRGQMIGSTIDHPHSQIMAFGMIPPIPESELSASKCDLCQDPDDDLLPFALGAGVFAAASRRSDRRIALTSRQAGGEPVLLSIDTLEPGSAAGWAAYPAGVAWALRQAGYLAGGADVAIDADLPAGAGLSSSAALECSVALALTGLYQVPVPRRELAALARRAENDFAGVPTGIMDQIAAMLGKVGHALLLDCRSGTETAVPLDPAAAGLTLLVIDTRARHALADGQYGSRRQACEQAASLLGVRSLRDVTGDPGALAGLTEPSLRRLAGHVVAENGRVLRAAELLRSGDQAAIGELLTASHRSLRDEFRMSWPQADEAVEAAIEAGAAGARMTGGGFGGSVVALVPADRADQIRRAVTRRFTQNHWPAPHFLDAVPSDGARRIGSALG